VFLTWLSNLTDLLPKILWTVGSVVLLCLLVLLAFKLIRIYRLLTAKTTCIEVIPPANNEQSIVASSQLFAALHGVGSSSSLFERLLHPSVTFTLEITSSKDKGIRYMLYCPKDKHSSLERLIHAYVPDAKLKTVGAKSSSNTQRLVSFRQKKHYAFPLKASETLELSDPLSYLTSAMANPAKDEQMIFQLITKPIVSREAEAIASKILDNEDLLHNLQNRKVNTTGIFSVINNFLFGILGAVGNLSAPQSKEDYMMAKRDMEYKKQVAKRLKPVRTLSYFEHELIESIHRKLSEPLFAVDMRVGITAGSKQVAKERLKNIKGAITLFNVPKYQQFIQNKLGDKYKVKWLQFKFAHKLPSFSRQSIFSSAELASLYHFPNKYASKTDNVVSSLSKTLAAPVALKNGQSFGVVVGQNVHHGVNTPIGLTDAERERHMYVIGGTGNGKTTMLLYGIVQDIQNGKGVAVLDPHGDLAETILGYIPPERINDVIYLNPDDLTHPIGMNLLELSSDLKGDDLLREKDLITESTISVLRKVFSEDDTGGHRIEYILRNAIQTSLTLEHPTLFTIFRLLNDTKYRQKVVRELEDEDLKIFWKNEIAKAGDMQRVKMSAGITSKIGRFLFSASAKRILEQEKSSIDFEEILDSGKILICNFSKGLIGEDTSALFGTTVLAKLQVAALKRARQKQTVRKAFYLYVDEFQNFATMSFVQMLSEARKYKLFLTMAEQSTQQQDEQRLVDIILANVGTVVAFRSGSPADERLVLPLFRPFIEEGEIANLPAYNFYMRIAAVEAREPLSGMTLLLDSEPDDEVTRQVIAESRNKYGKRVKESMPTKTTTQKKTDTSSEENNAKSVNKPNSSDRIAVVGK